MPLSQLLLHSTVTLENEVRQAQLGGLRPPARWQLTVALLLALSGWLLAPPSA